MIDQGNYNIFYKQRVSIEDLASLKWDVFLSSYNSSERVQIVYSNVNSVRKYWLIHEEYGYGDAELPTGKTFRLVQDEASSIVALLDEVSRDFGTDVSSLNMCIDLTGFMRPHLMFLAAYLEAKGVKKFDVLYTEPERYAKKDKTQFSIGSPVVRHVASFEGVNSVDGSKDFLVIGSGYDHPLISSVADYKGKAEKAQIFGLPSLRANMYTENILNASRAKDAIGKYWGTPSFHFAPANDPFVTASVLSEIVRRKESRHGLTNLYLSPLATKVQALGFALFYLGERRGTSTNIVYPISARYERETSKGVERIWRYTIEYPIF